MKGPSSQEVQCHEKKSTFHPTVSKESVKSFTCMGMRGSFAGWKDDGIEYRGLGRRQEDQIRTFSKFRAKEADSNGMQVRVQGGVFERVQDQLDLIANYM